MEGGRAAWWEGDEVEWEMSREENGVFQSIFYVHICNCEKKSKGWKKEPSFSRERSQNTVKWQTLQSFDWCACNYPLCGPCLHCQLTRQVSHVHFPTKSDKQECCESHTSSSSLTTTTTKTLSIMGQWVSMRWLWTLEKDRKKKMSYHLNVPPRQAK